MTKVLPKSYQKGREDVKKEIRKWTKGRTVTKDSLRNYLNNL